jgi:hypothetical protein
MNAYPCFSVLCSEIRGQRLYFLRIRLIVFVELSKHVEIKAKDGILLWSKKQTSLKKIKTRVI